MPPRCPQQQLWTANAFVGVKVHITQLLWLLCYSFLYFWLRKKIWNFGSVLKWLSFNSCNMQHEAHTHAWPVRKPPRCELHTQQVIVEQFITELSPYEYHSAFIDHSLLFPLTLPPSCFWVTFLKASFQALGLSQGCELPNWKLIISDDEESPIKIQSYLNCFSLDHMWKHILLPRVTESWSHITLMVA